MKIPVSPLSDEVRAMIESRRDAERHGDFSPMGRLLWLRTDHGTIHFPIKDGEPTGPDLARTANDELIFPGLWLGLPAVRVNSSKPCPDCLHACDVCVNGRKLCELCGGKSWTPGPWVLCGGSGCTKETGHFRGECKECGGTGQVPEQLPCQMCDAGKLRDRKGFALMVCPKCKGTSRYATGRRNGSINWDATPACESCAGSCCVGKFQKQDVRKFLNASIRPCKEMPGFLALGPIYCFALREYESTRTLIFDVTEDAARDLLMLLVSKVKNTTQQKAFLVGGVVREHGGAAVTREPKVLEMRAR